MIFITIGTQEPFDRLIKAIDKNISIFNGDEIVAQIAKSNYKIKNFKSFEFLSPKDFQHYFSNAELIISHAGMGTIITALVQKKPLLVMPRLVKYGEHRNEHQLSTAKRFDALNYVNVAYDETELVDKLKTFKEKPVELLSEIGDFASIGLINSLKDYVNKGV